MTRSVVNRSGEAFAVDPGAPQAVWPDPARPVELSARERVLLDGLAEGWSNAELAAAARVSTWTVKTDLKRLFRRLGAKDRAHAVAQAFRAGLLS